MPALRSTLEAEWRISPGAPGAERRIPPGRSLGPALGRFLGRPGPLPVPPWAASWACGAGVRSGPVALPAAAAAGGVVFCGECRDRVWSWARVAFEAA